MSDVFLPDAGELAEPWADAPELEGTIVDFSDSGSAPRVFAVVEILRKRTLVVPVAKLSRRVQEA